MLITFGPVVFPQMRLKKYSHRDKRIESSSLAQREVARLLPQKQKGWGHGLSVEHLPSMERPWVHSLVPEGILKKGRYSHKSSKICIYRCLLQHCL
jgi:hypothetical protein